MCCRNIVGRAWRAPTLAEAAATIDYFYSVCFGAELMRLSPASKMSWRDSLEAKTQNILQIKKEIGKKLYDQMAAINMVGP